MSGPTADLFADDALQQPAGREQIGDESYVLRGYALPWIDQPSARATRHSGAIPVSANGDPGGFAMSAALSSCGALGWTSAHHGYRYTSLDPRSRQPWPAMPDELRELAVLAAADAGFIGFNPDACLINRYVAGRNVPAPGQE